jgi:hypothetical protein
LYGGSLGLAWTPARFRLELAAEYLAVGVAGTPPGNPAVFMRYPGGVGGVPSSVREQALFLGSLRGCYVARWTSFELAPCGDADAGEQGGLAHVGLGGGLFTAWHFVPRFAAILRNDAMATVTKPFQGAVAFRSSLGAEVRF